MTVVLIEGDDETLVSQVLQEEIDQIIMGGDRSLLLEEVLEQNFIDESESITVSPLINSLQTPSFFGDNRLVVARSMALFSTKDRIAPLVDLLKSEGLVNDLILVWEKPTSSNRLAAIPKSLKEVLKSAGAKVINASPKGKKRKELINTKLDKSLVILDQSARNEIMDFLSEDPGLIDPLLNTLLSTFGEDARLSSLDIKPYLVQSSDIPPWDLTDALDAGNIPKSIEMLHRMINSGGKHPLQIMAVLHSHYQKAFTLEGSGVTNESQAALELGMKGSTYPAKKALSLSKRLGFTKLKRAVNLLFEADVDIRGASGLEPNLVIEVLVARLAALSK